MSANVSKSHCMVHLNTLLQEICVWKGNSYKCIFNKFSFKNNCPRLFSANSSLRVFTKSGQYYFNVKGRFTLAQAVSKSGPKSLRRKSTALLAILQCKPTSPSTIFLALKQRAHWMTLETRDQMRCNFTFDSSPSCYSLTPSFQQVGVSLTGLFLLLSNSVVSEASVLCWPSTLGLLFLWRAASVCSHLRRAR